MDHSGQLEPQTCSGCGSDALLSLSAVHALSLKDLFAVHYVQAVPDSDSSASRPRGAATQTPPQPQTQAMPQRSLADGRGESSAAAQTSQALAQQQRPHSGHGSPSMACLQQGASDGTGATRLARSVSGNSQPSPLAPQRPSQHQQPPSSRLGIVPSRQFSTAMPLPSPAVRPPAMPAPNNSQPQRPHAMGSALQQAATPRCMHDQVPSSCQQCRAQLDGLKDQLLALMTELLDLPPAREHQRPTLLQRRQALQAQKEALEAAAAAADYPAAAMGPQSAIPSVPSFPTPSHMSGTYTPPADHQPVYQLD